MKSRLQRLVPIAAFAWLFAIILSYYVTHKPFDQALAVAGVLAFWRVLVGFALITIAGAIGRLFFPMEDQTPLVRASIQSALGLGILGLALMLLGSTIGLNPIVLYLPLPLLVVLLRQKIRSWLADLGDLRQINSGTGRFSKALTLITAAVLVCTLIISLAPPLKYDALVYHLTIPETYLRLGRVDFLPGFVMSGMPQTAEMLYTWAIALGGLPAAATLGWYFSVVAALGVFAYLRCKLDGPAPWVAAATLFGGYSLAMATSWAYVDWLTLLFGFGCLFALEQWRQAGDRKTLILAGLFAGLGFATKYTAGMLALIGAGVIGWHAWKRREAYLPALVPFGVAATMFAVPWMAKNWISTGNPIYPFFFPQTTTDALRLAVFQDTTSFGNWADIFFLPFRATYLGIEDRVGYSFSLGPLFLGLSAIAVLVRKRIAEQPISFVENAAGFTLLGLIVWVAGNQYSGYLIQTRMYFPLFPAFAVLTAVGYQAIGSMKLPGVRIGRLAGILILLVLFLNLVEVATVTIRAGSLPVVLGIDPPATYLSTNLGQYQDVVETINELPDDSKVQMLYETRGLYCAPKCLSDAILAEWKVAYYTHDSSEAVFTDWASQGITHILVFDSGVDFFLEMEYVNHTQEELNALKRSVKNLEMVQQYGEAYTLYRLPDF